VGFLDARTFEKTFSLLIEKYCSAEKLLLSKVAYEAGIAIIKNFGEQACVLSSILEKYMNKTDRPQYQVSSLIFLGVLSPFIKDRANQ